MDILQFDEELHIYKYGKLIIPSVTQVLSILSDEIYGKCSDTFLKKASYKGSKVHFRTEMYDRYKVNEQDDETDGFMEAYLKFLQDYNPEVLLIEQKVYHRKMLYAGTLDRVYRINGKVVLVDIKTTSKLYDRLVALQNSAYAMCLESMKYENPIDELAVLHLKNDGTYEFIILKRRDDLFITIYKTYNMKKTLLEE